MKFTEETLKRATRTFLQAFLPALAVNIGLIASDNFNGKFLLYSVIVPACAMGLSAVMNLEKTGENDDTESTL